MPLPHYGASWDGLDSVFFFCTISLFSKAWGKGIFKPLMADTIISPRCPHLPRFSGRIFLYVVVDVVSKQDCLNLGVPRRWQKSESVSVGQGVTLSMGLTSSFIDFSSSALHLSKSSSCLCSRIDDVGSTSWVGSARLGLVGWTGVILSHSFSRCSLTMCLLRLGRGSPTGIQDQIPWGPGMLTYSSRSSAPSY